MRVRGVKWRVVAQPSDPQGVKSTELWGDVGSAAECQSREQLPLRSCPLNTVQGVADTSLHALRSKAAHGTVCKLNHLTANIFN